MPFLKLSLLVLQCNSYMYSPFLGFITVTIVTFLWSDNIIFKWVFLNLDLVSIVDLFYSVILWQQYNQREGSLNTKDQFYPTHHLIVVTVMKILILKQNHPRGLRYPTRSLYIINNCINNKFHHVQPTYQKRYCISSNNSRQRLIL